MSSFATVILAAGKGKRMKSELPKVFHSVLGKTLIARVLDSTLFTKSLQICVISPSSKEMFLKKLPQNVLTCIQTEQKGTGDAVKSAIPLLIKNKIQSVLIIPGDMPLIKKETLKKLISTHKKEKNSVTILTGLMENPKGYGRIIRNEKNQITAIVEEKDLLHTQKEIKEVNTGVYVFDTELLRDCLSKIHPNNAQKEYYLTDTINIASNKNAKVGGFCIGFSDECSGINSRMDLANAVEILRKQIIEKHLINGVTIEAPGTVYIDDNVKIGKDTIIKPFTIISHGVKIGNNCEVGPFSHIREGTILKDFACVGNFVEVKKSILGKKTKAKHLSYLGNATLGDRVNIGAGTITANYDGFNKHATKIGNGCKIGSNTVIVAPNIIGNDVITGAGTVIPANKNIKPRSLVYGIPAKVAKTNLTVLKK
ncbi:MAG: hypothetical protein ACD_79C00427G0002 [uncultured bacterium]|nr:MAG: hypothetical protein ACD_79C00427G0002 [uncultured bacterium]